MLHRYCGVMLGFLLGPALAQSFAPLARPSHVGNPSAFDTVRRRLVMFDTDGTTWELDGGNLLPRTSQRDAPQPTPRTGHAMCFDEAQRRVLMFGGSAVGGIGPLFDETWAYDGSSWTQLVGGPAPGARGAAALTWDAGRNRAVMWGGTSSSSLLTDTWEHDGSTWLQRSPATTPSFGDGNMVFDRQRNVAVLVVFNSVQLAQAWEWNGTDWVFRAGLNITNGGGTPTLAFDASRNRTVLAGADSRIHEWDGASWSSSAVPPQPFLRSFATGWFDPGCGCVILAGGRGMSVANRTDLWQWNGQTLTQLQPDVAGPQASNGVMFADPARGRVVHFGGIRFGGVLGTSYSDDTWALAGGAWSAVPSSASPSSRMLAAATHDLLRGESLLFGGRGAAGVLADTWSLGSAGWVARSTTGPSPRTRAAMAADLVRGVIVLFGGESASLINPFFDDTWEWNGTLWTQRATTVRPPARAGAAMAFHPQMGTMLLFGGFGLTGGANDTWTWDGSQWTRRPSATQPPPLTTPTMSSDLTSNRCILVGLNVVSLGDVRHQVWTYDGSDWLQALELPALATGLWFPCASGARLDTMVCSRDSAPAAAAELTFTPGRVATIGAGCGTPASTLLVRSRPRVGATNGLEVVANAGRAVLFALDLQSGNTPLGGGCTVWLSPGFAGMFQVSDAAGLASQPLSLPAAALGLNLLAQAAVLEPLSSNGLVLTQGLRLVLGD